MSFDDYPSEEWKYDLPLNLTKEEKSRWLSNTILQWYREMSLGIIKREHTNLSDTDPLVVSKFYEYMEEYLLNYKIIDYANIFTTGYGPEGALKTIYLKAFNEIKPKGWGLKVVFPIKWNVSFYENKLRIV